MAAVALAPLLGGAASAQAVIPVGPGDPSSTTVEYGEYWYGTFVIPETISCTSCLGTISEQGAAQPFASDVPVFSGVFSFGAGQAKPLSAGTHRLDMKVREPWFGDSGASSAPFVVTVTPAKLAIDLRVVTDPNAPSNAIVSATLTGAFVDGLIPASYRDPTSPAMPAGRWVISISDGESAVFERTLDTEAGGAVDLVDYWMDVDPSTDFVASASFTPQGAASSNFAVTQVDSLSYTSPTASVEPGSETPAPADPDDGLGEAEVDAGGIPVGLVAAAGVVALLALIAAVILVVALRRGATRPAASATTADADAAVAGTAEEAHDGTR